MTAPPPDRPPASASRAPRYALAAVVALGAALRAQRLFHAGYHGDEPFEIFVRRAVLEHGWPLLPSGQVSAYGGILLWPGALFTWIGGLSVFWNRLPFFLLGTAAVWATGRVAGRVLPAWAGVAAAAVVAFHPGHVEWSSSVKIYAAASLFGALALGPWLDWVVRREDAAAPRFALFASLLALVHPASAFPVAGFGIAGLLVRGPRFALAPRTIAAFAAPLAGLGLFAWVIRTFDPGMSHTIEVGGAPDAERPLVALLKHLFASVRSHGWRSAWQAVPFALALAGLVCGAVRAAFGRARPADAPERAAIAASAAWGASLVAMSALAKFQGGAYLLPALPLLATGAAGGLAAVVSLVRGPRWIACAAGAVALASHALATRAAWPPVFDPLERVAAVYARLARESKAGEVSLGGGPHAALWSEGRLRDHVVFGGGLGAMAFVRDGRPYDRFLGNPVLRTVDEIRPVVESAPRTWFLVTDKDLSSGRVLPEVHAWLLARMTLVAEAPGLRLYATPAR